MNRDDPPPVGDTAPARRSRTTAASLLVAGAVLAAAAALAFLALRAPSAPTSLEGRTRAVASTLRCPSCQDLSVADSPSAIAREIRLDIARRLRAGQSPAAIRAYYVSRYGAWMLLSPPKSGLTLGAWLLPLLLLAAGLATIVVAVRRWTADAPLPAASAGGQEDELTASDRRMLERAVATVEEAE